jgi:hypothetical protein
VKQGARDPTVESCVRPFSFLLFPFDVALTLPTSTTTCRQFDYGSRVAIWRILDLFEENKQRIPITFYAVARAFERNPHIAKAAEECVPLPFPLTPFQTSFLGRCDENIASTSNRPFGRRVNFEPPILTPSPVTVVDTKSLPTATPGNRTQRWSRRRRKSGFARRSSRSRRRVLLVVVQWGGTMVVRRRTRRTWSRRCTRNLGAFPLFLFFFPFSFLEIDALC